MTSCLVSMDLTTMKGEKMKTEEQKFEEFLGKKEFKKFQIRAAMLIGILMAENNVDIEEAQELLIKQLIARRT